MAVYPRISGRRGNEIELGMTFSHGGVPTDPYAITRIDIYKTQVLPHNLVATILLPRPCDTGYPSPIEHVTETIPAGDCGTGVQPGMDIPGKFKFNWTVPDDLQVPDVYIDVWSYIATNPCSLAEFATSCGTTDCYPDLLDPALANLMLSSCGRFWVYSDNWEVSDGLETIRLGFEPLDQKFRTGEIRPLEVGITPLPLYDYNYNLVAPKLPFLTATIQISTQANEILIQDAPMEIGLRSGSYRNSPYVLKYCLDTTQLLIGTYKYRVMVTLPDGTTRASGDFILTIA
jgi:hypothetical protein